MHPGKKFAAIVKLLLGFIFDNFIGRDNLQAEIWFLYPVKSTVNNLQIKNCPTDSSMGVVINGRCVSTLKFYTNVCDYHFLLTI